MKKILLTVLALGVIFTSCVDDFEDARPPVPIDGPWGYVGVSAEAIEASDDRGGLFYWTSAGETLVFTIDIVDAPGTIAGISASLSNIVQPEDIGTVSTSVGSAVGQTSGTLTVEYVVPAEFGDDPETPEIEFGYNEIITVVVTDGQEEPKSRTFTLDIWALDVCYSDRVLNGSYTARVTGTDNMGVETFVRSENINIFIDSGNPATNFPGRYEVDDINFGFLDGLGFGDPVLGVLFVCESDIVGQELVTTPEVLVDGVVNEDGTIDLNWTSVRTFFDEDDNEVQIPYTGTVNLTPNN